MDPVGPVSRNPAVPIMNRERERECVWLSSVAVGGRKHSNEVKWKIYCIYIQRFSSWPWLLRWNIDKWMRCSLGTSCSMCGNLWTGLCVESCVLQMKMCFFISSYCLFGCILVFFLHGLIKIMLFLVAFSCAKRPHKCFFFVYKHSSPILYNGSLNEMINPAGKNRVVLYYHDSNKTTPVNLGYLSSILSCTNDFGAFVFRIFFTFLYFLSLSLPL